MPVPTGEWFLLEFDWLSHQERGRVRVRVNDRTVTEHVGRTQRTHPNGKLYMFMVYTGEGSTDIGAASQWIDEVELWETGPLREP